MSFVKNLVLGPDKNTFQATASTNDVSQLADMAASGQGAFGIERRKLNGDIGTGLAQQQAGFGGLQSTLGQQQSFGDVLRAQAMGQGGPSPADLMLKSNLAKANAGVAGTLASNKGINPALATRMAAQTQGANALQAGNDAAVLRAQQQLAAQQAYQQQQAAQAQTAAAMAGTGQNLYGGAGQQQAAQNAQLGQLLGVSAQGQLANQQANMEAQKINAGVEQGNVDAANANAGAIMNTIGTVAGGMLGGPAGAAIGGKLGGAMVGKAHGGPIEAPPKHMSFAEMVAHHLTTQSHEHMAKGGPVPYKFPALDVRADAATEGQTAAQPGQEGTDSEGKKKSLKLAMGGPLPMYDLGGHVPGEAPHPGDDDRNDIVPALLSPGEVVLPRSVAHDPEKSKRFVEHIRGQTPTQYGDIRRGRR